MRIGVLSDTHMRKVTPLLVAIIEDIFKDTEMIIHAGDIVSPEVLNYLENSGVKAVMGNMDSFYVKNRLPPKLVFEAAGFKLGLMHGWGSPVGLAQKVRKEFREIDCLVYGHSHDTHAELIRGEYYFNPGTASGGLWHHGKSVGILTLEDEITGEIIEL